MIKNKNEKPINSQNRIVGMGSGRTIRGVEAIVEVENVEGMDEIEKDMTEDAQDELYLPDYGGSE